jgi:hypothetical protein
MMGMVGEQEMVRTPAAELIAVIRKLLWGNQCKLGSSQFQLRLAAAVGFPVVAGTA